MTTSHSHVITQRVAFRTWMHTKVCDQKRCFQEVHDNEKHDEGIILLSFH
jgi:hypothetical protein